MKKTKEKHHYFCVPVFATVGSRPSAAGTDIAALKFSRLNVVLNKAI